MDPRPVVVVTGEDTTADAVITALYARDVPACRFDLSDISSSLQVSAYYGDGAGVRGFLRTPSRRVDLGAVRSLYYRRPHLAVYTRLDEQDARFAADQARFGLGGMLAALPGCLYVNHPRCAHAAEYKPVQLTIAQEVGFLVPPTLVTNDLDDARAFIACQHPVVYKPVVPANYRIDGRLWHLWVREVDLAELDEGVTVTPHQFQKKIAKAADVRVTVVGQEVFCVRIRSPLTDWRERYDLIEDYTVIPPPEELRERLHTYLRRFGLAYGCFDFGIGPEGTWWFFECNPAGEWAWLEAETDLPIAETFASLLERGADR